MIQENKFIDEDGNVAWEALKRVLDEGSPDARPTGIAKPGEFEAAAETLAEIAKNADDPLLQLKAERYLTDVGLGSMLVDWSDVPLDDL